MYQRHSQGMRSNPDPNQPLIHSFLLQCTDFVDKYASQIIDLILSGAGAKAVCTGLGLCALKKETVTIQGGLSQVKSQEKVVCVCCME